jgi:hypothetical protein
MENMDLPQNAWREYEVWTGGFSKHDCAQTRYYYGKYMSVSFYEACIKAFYEEKEHITIKNGIPYFKEFPLYDNKKDAMKSSEDERYKYYAKKRINIISHVEKEQSFGRINRK